MNLFRYFMSIWCSFIPVLPIPWWINLSPTVSDNLSHLTELHILIIYLVEQCHKIFHCSVWRCQRRVFPGWLGIGPILWGVHLTFLLSTSAKYHPPSSTFCVVVQCRISVVEPRLKRAQVSCNIYVLPARDIFILCAIYRSSNNLPAYWIMKQTWAAPRHVLNLHWLLLFLIF